MDQKNNPSLRGVPVVERGGILSKMYKDLPQKKRQELKKRAQKHPGLQKRAKTRRSPVRKSDFSRFVQQKYNEVKGLNYKKRFSALSQLYQLEKPLDVQIEKAMKATSAAVTKVVKGKNGVKAAKQKKAKVPKHVKSAKSTVKAAAAKQKMRSRSKTAKGGSKKTNKKSK